MECTLDFVALERVVKSGLLFLGANALAHLCLRNRPEAWIDGRPRRTPVHDDELLAQVRKQTAQLLSFGYRRACALLNRQQTAGDLSRVKHKRVYRVKACAMACCCQKHPEANNRVTCIRARSRSLSSDQCWCPDGFETKCNYGPTVTAIFAKDGCDREMPIEAV